MQFNTSAAADKVRAARNKSTAVLVSLLLAGLLAPGWASADAFGNADVSAAGAAGVAARLERVEKELKELKERNSAPAAQPGQPGKSGKSGKSGKGVSLPPTPDMKIPPEDDLVLDYEVLGHVNEEHLVRQGGKTRMLTTAELKKFQAKEDAKARRLKESGSGASLTLPPPPVGSPPSVKPNTPAPAAAAAAAAPTPTPTPAPVPAPAKK